MDNAAKALDLYNEFIDELAAEDPPSDGFVLSIVPEYGGTKLWMHDETTGDPHQVVDFVLRCARAFRLRGRWGFQWANSCSRPRIGAFSGGAHLLDLGRRKTISWMPSNARRVVVKARVVRQQGTRFRSAPLARHIAYLRRDGVTRDGAKAHLFDAGSDEADSKAFAERCEDAKGQQRLSLATRSDFTLAEQVTAPGATWLDRQLLAKDTALANAGFGTEVREAMAQRIDHLTSEGLARQQGERVVFAPDLIGTLRQRDLDQAAVRLAAQTGLEHRPAKEGEIVSGVYRQRVALSSGRFAMVDDGLGFQLVPWRPALEQKLGRQVSGTMSPGGSVDWNFGRKRGLGI